MLIGYFHRSTLLLPHISQTGMFSFRYLSLFLYLLPLMCCFLVFDNLFDHISLLQNNKCLVIDWPMAKAFVAVRSVTDVLFSVNILLQVCFLCFHFWYGNLLAFNVSYFIFIAVPIGLCSSWVYSSWCWPVGWSSKTNCSPLLQRKVFAWLVHSDATSAGIVMLELQLDLSNGNWNMFIYHSFLLLFTDIDIMDHTRTLRHIWGKLCKKPFTRCSSFPVHSKVI